MRILLVTFLLFIFGASNVAAEANWRSDPIESKQGIHLLSDYGRGHHYLSSNLEIANVQSELNKLNWTKNFLQFVVVTQPGISMEVGGSLNGIDGLAGVYRNRLSSTEAYTFKAPESVKEMEEILKSFLRNDNSWKAKFQFHRVQNSN